MKTYRLTEIIKTRMILIVSLPENDAETAMAVEEAGADAIKVHLNCKHRASGTTFGTWEEEKEKIQEIPYRLKIPVGIVPGAETVATMAEMEEISGLGFDFLDIFSHHMPCPYFDLEKLSKVIAIDYMTKTDLIPYLILNGLEVIEASIINPEGYGHPLTSRDLAAYNALISRVNRPVFIPTQRKITTEDVPYLHRIGANGIAIGAIVTGKTKEEIITATEEFKKAIDRINRKITF